MAGDRLLASDLAVLAPGALHPDAPQVDLRLARSPDGATYLARQRVGYPFHLGRSLFIPGDPEGMPTLYVQSCSGGIFEHDRLAWRVTAEPGCQAHLTSSASTIVHAMRGGEAVQEVAIDAQREVLLEYLPDPLVLFPGARLRSRLLRLPFGDQALCLDSALFRRLGGYPAVERGEDHLLVWRAHRARVPVRPVGAAVTTSSRRYLAKGWAWTTVRHVGLTVTQALPEFLALLRGR